MTFLLENWKLILMGLLLAIAALFFKLWRSEVEDFAEFKAQVKVIGEVQAQETKKTNDHNEALRKESDNENAKTRRDLAGVYGAYASLRDQRTRSRTVSSLPASASHPDTICFQREKFAGAVGVIETGVPVITRKGDDAIVDLNSARMWAKTLTH